MKRNLATLFMVVGIYGPSPAAEMQSPYDLFYERCLSSGPEFEHTVALARDRKLTPLATDMSFSLTPVADPVALEGWIVNVGDDGAFEALVVSRGTVGQKAVEGCTVAFSGIDAEAFERSLLDRAGAKASGEERGQDRLHKLYASHAGSRDLAIILSVPLYPKGSDQVVASAVAEQQWDN